MKYLNQLIWILILILALILAVFLGIHYRSQDSLANDFEYELTTEITEEPELNAHSTEVEALNLDDLNIDITALETSQTVNFRFQEYNGTLEIPSIKVYGRVISGMNPAIMDKAFWHIDKIPGQPGQGLLVIFGHRFLKLPPARDTFFQLDKVKVGDKVIIKTDLGLWKYQVKRIYVVDSKKVNILQPDSINVPTLRLVTCHPVWSDSHRLVVEAVLEKSNQVIY